MFDHLLCKTHNLVMWVEVKCFLDLAVRDRFEAAHPPRQRTQRDETGAGRTGNERH